MQKGVKFNVNNLQTSDLPDHTDFMVLPWVSLFPGSLLPLYIFEERYRDMTERALAGNRIFAIAHCHDDATLAPIAGLGIIRACVVNEDGTSNLVLQGVSRVEFSKVEMSPRPHGSIRIISDGAANGDLSEVRANILEVCEGLFHDGPQSLESFTSILKGTISDSGFADLIGSTLIQDPIHRRMVFETIDVDSRMSLVLEILSSKIEPA